MTDLGFIAQDVQAHFPEIISTDEDGNLGMRYSGITAINIAAIQEIVTKLKAAGIEGF